MIRGFRDKKTEQFFAGAGVKEFSSFRRVAERKLTMLDSASDIKDLLSPAGNHLLRLDAQNQLRSVGVALVAAPATVQRNWWQRCA